MANPGQPTIQRGSKGEPVKRAQRALRRGRFPELIVDGDFGPLTEECVKLFQERAGLRADGIVGPKTWAALPDGSAMPVLKNGSTGRVVSRLQTVLTDEAPGRWQITPQGIDGIFGLKTKASVEALQNLAHIPVDGVVGDRTWGVELAGAGGILERFVGLEFAEMPVAH
jgi:peptidoglycan hydrolase-like protein with peptidoglycan-binding domain